MRGGSGLETIHIRQAKLASLGGQSGVRQTLAVDFQQLGKKKYQHLILKKGQVSVTKPGPSSFSGGSEKCSGFVLQNRSIFRIIFIDGQASGMPGKWPKNRALANAMFLKPGCIISRADITTRR